MKIGKELNLKTQLGRRLLLGLISLEFPMEPGACTIKSYRFGINGNWTNFVVS
jgi:hypothetical protein